MNSLMMVSYSDLGSGPLKALRKAIHFADIATTTLRRQGASPRVRRHCQMVAGAAAGARFTVSSSFPNRTRYHDWSEIHTAPVGTPGRRDSSSGI